MKFKNSPQYLLATMLFISSQSCSIQGRNKTFRHKNYQHSSPTIFQNSTNQPISLTIFNRKNKITSQRTIKPYQVVSLMINRIKHKVLVNNQVYQLRESQQRYQIV